MAWTIPQDEYPRKYTMIEDLMGNEVANLV